MKIGYTLGRLGAYCVSSNVSLYRLYVHLKPGDFWNHPFDGCDLLVDGAGGGAQTSLQVYLQKWNPALRIAHHTHAVAPVRYCLDNDIPCVICVRSPEDQWRSICTRFTREPPWLHRWFFDRYARFVARHQDRLFLAPFEEIVSEPAALVHRINQRFGLQLETGDNVAPKIRTTLPRSAT